MDTSKNDFTFKIFDDILTIKMPNESKGFRFNFFSLKDKVKKFLYFKEKIEMKGGYSTYEIKKIELPVHGNYKIIGLVKDLKKEELEKHIKYEDLIQLDPQFLLLKKI